VLFDVKTHVLTKICILYWGKNQLVYDRMMENMLTGRLYLSSELSGGVFDEASRGLDEEQIQILEDRLERAIVDGLCVG
jgi:hypothetical protein